MKLNKLDDTSVTDEETNLGDDYEVEVAALATGHSSGALTKTVRFGFVQTHKIGRGIDPPSSESFTDSSDCELAANIFFSVDDYETERQLVSEKTKRMNNRKTAKAKHRTEHIENKLQIQTEKNKVQLSRYYNNGISVERMANPPSTEWLEQHRSKCYPPSPKGSPRQQIIQQTPAARILNTTSREEESSYRIVNVDDHSFEYYSPSPGHSKPKVGKRLGIFLKGKKVPLIEHFT